MMQIILLLPIFFSVVAQAPVLSKSEIIEPVCLKANVTEKQRIVACAIEKVARKRGFKSEHVIRGLIVNAFAESELNPNAISPGHKSFGIFQLHVDGLGYKMSRKEMFDVETSTNVIVDFMDEQNLNYNKMGEKQATRTICSTVLRPKDKKLKMKERVELLSKLF